MSELRLVLTTPPTAEPVSAAEAKAHARIDDEGDNQLVTALVMAARMACENYTRRAFIKQSWTMYLDAWPCERSIEVPRAPLRAVTHIKTYTDVDAATTWASSNYYVDTATKPGRIFLRDASSWPDVTRVANGIEILFEAGYGPNPDDVPQAIKTAILMTFAHFYEHRGDSNEALPESAMLLLSSYKDWLV